MSGLITTINKADGGSSAGDFENWGKLPEYSFDPDLSDACGLYLVKDIKFREQDDASQKDPGALGPLSDFIL